MSDIAIATSPDGFSLDFSITNQDLTSDAGLRTAVLISLFSDQRVGVESLPFGETSQAGWWGDEFLPDQPDQIGSKIWTLQREKRLPATLTNLEQFARESLQWLLDDGVAKSIDIETEFTDEGYAALSIVINRTKGEPANFKFSNVWNEELGLTG